MTDKNKKGIFIVAITLTVLTASALFLFKNKKVQYAKTIVKYGGTKNYAWLLNTTEDYLKAWAENIKKGNEFFELNGKKYYTQGGTAVK